MKWWYGVFLPSGLIGAFNSHQHLPVGLQTSALDITYTGLVLNKFCHDSWFLDIAMPTIRSTSGEFSPVWILLCTFDLFF